MSRHSLKILFVDATVEMSIADSSRGYHNALKRQGHDVKCFRSMARMEFVRQGLAKQGELAKDAGLIAELASEMMVVEALKLRADLVIVSSGLGIHPNGLELLNRAGFPIALIMTESPYEDEQQAKYARFCGHVFTNDQTSSLRRGWHYLPSAYDPEFHHPFPYDPAEACDVLFVGTGWPERQQLLEGVDWSGIHLKIMGQWPGLTEGDSPLRPYCTQVIVTNDETARLYSSAKIAINHHRHHPAAYSLNPRGYELAACGVFQISDYREELFDIFGKKVPRYDNGAFNSPALLEELIRSWLENDDYRRDAADRQRKSLLAGHHTFDDRAKALIDTITKS